MRNLARLFLSLFIVLALLKNTGFAQMPKAPVVKEEYFRARVEQILREQINETAGFKAFTQTIGLVVQSGHEKGKDVVAYMTMDLKGSEAQKYKEGESVIVQKATLSGGQEAYTVVDRYRLDAVGYIFLLFFFLVILVAGKKGAGSILGMLFGLFVISAFVAPLIVAGYSPLLVSIAGALIIMVVSIYLAHGVTLQTTSAVLSTFLSLILAGVLSFVFVSFSHLTGVGNEDNYGLQFGLEHIDLRGLLLGGIIIGTLGILDDITTSQAAVVFEIAKANASLNFRELVLRGLNVGREHVASLVNTLFLVYAGVSLGLFIVFIINPTKQPYWVLLNHQLVTEEAVRTLAGSVTLTLAIPISTVISAFFVKRFVHENNKKRNKRT